MSDYKDSLNLPVTDFPMKANLAQREPQILAQWEAEDIYQQLRQARKGAKSFILHDGPPYANGHLHCGHALNKILKDIIVKSKTLSGFDAPFIPGWDCHGLPIELNVEKKYGAVGTKLTAAQFREECRNYASSQINLQKAEFKRLGVFGQWNEPYSTMNFLYEANIIRALGKIIANGHLERGFKPVHWCLDCGSALAEAEVDYEEKNSLSIDVSFRIVEPERVAAIFGVSLSSKPIIVPIWTTTPWSLPGNEAVSVNPELDYELIETKDKYFILAGALSAQVMTRYGIEQYQLRSSIKGQHLLQLTVQHPFFDRAVPIVLGHHVSVDAGTGCVHIAPAHGPDDYLIGKKYHLPMVNPIQMNGCYASNVPLFAGMFVRKANDKILETLKEKGTLLCEKTIVHSYPHCWRHKTPMIFLATPQWFINMDKQGLRQIISSLIHEVNWIPDWGKARIAGMINTRPDWCVSRQRAWGTPIPVFLHKDTKELHPKTLEFIELIAQQIEKTGIEGWFNLKAEEFLGADAADYEKSIDTLDVWFDSGVSHFCVLQQEKTLGFPADLYLEGSDQHRGWFNSSLSTAAAMYATTPYKMVLTHGYTVDAEGRKLSKSRGNYVSLDKLIQQHGAEILRLWVASTDFRNEVSISEDIIRQNADAYRRIRNTIRFLLANLFDFDPQQHLTPINDMVALDQWVIKRTQNLQQEILAYYESYQFHFIYQKILNFCTDDLGSFFLDVIKDRQYTCGKESIARRSCQTAMYYILQGLSRWIAPILSFTADEIWSHLPGKHEKSVFLTTWYQDWPEIPEVNFKFWATLKKIRDEVNKAIEAKRKTGEVGSSLAAEITIYAKPEFLTLLQKMGEELRFIFITSGAAVKPLDALASNTAGIFSNQELGIAIDVTASQAPKCERCWHRCSEIGHDEKYPDLCKRCINTLAGQDEKRKFA